MIQSKPHIVYEDFGHVCGSGCHHNESGLMGFGNTGFSLADALTNPDQVIEKYKGEAIKYGSYAIIALVVLNHLQLHVALNQKLKRFIKRSGS